MPLWQPRHRLIYQARRESARTPRVEHEIDEMLYQIGGTQQT